MTVPPQIATPLEPGEFARMMSACGFASSCLASSCLASSRMAVAVSGGGDSMALALLAHAWGQDAGVEVVALSVDHGLRAEAADEAAQVARWLGARHMDHHILTWVHDTLPTSAVQARARAARYGLMRDWCADHGAGALLTAHHLGDQAETVLMRLRKGTGLMGLAGMSRCRDLDGVALLRPVLDVPKARLVATLEALGQDWIEDPSNRDMAYERVRTRAVLAHLHGEGVTAERLGRVAQAAGRVRRVLERAAGALVQNDDKTVSIDAAALARAAEPVAQVALSQALQRVGGGAYPPHRDKVSRLLTWMTAQTDAAPRSRTLGGCVVVRKAGRFHFSPEGPRKSLIRGENAAINCGTALAPGGQKPYIQRNSEPAARQV